MIRRIGCIGVVVALAGTLQARADIAYDTFSTGFGYEVLAGSNVTGAQSIAGYTDTANQFTSAAGGAITDIWVAVSNAAGPNGFDVNLRSDFGGAPGDVIHTWNLTDAAFAFDGQYHAPVHIDVTDTVELQAGATYWLELHATDPQSLMVWHFTSPPIFETVAQRTSPTAPWNVFDPGFTSAFAIAVIPAPGAFMLALPGMAIISRRRRNH